MRTILTNFGSMGDIRPMLALAVELRRHGHEPIMALAPNFAPAAQQLQLAFAPIGPDIRPLQRELLIAGTEAGDSIKQVAPLYTQLAEFLPQMYEQLLHVCATADLLIGGGLQPAARMVHEITNIPFVSVQLAHFGGAGVTAFQELMAANVNPFRARLGLAPLTNVIYSDANSPQLALYAISRHVLLRPAGWPPHYHMTGYFFLDDEGWQPDPELVDFLGAGEPPVVVTFSSTVYKDPEAVSKLICAAIDQAGCRAIILAGWGELAASAASDRIYTAGFVPHHYLFPKAACVVHASGAGTAAEVFRSGAPNIFVPHTVEQLIWARLAESGGFSVATIPFQQLTAENLAHSIRTALENPAIRRKTAALSAKIQLEHGVGKARLLIDDLLHKLGCTQPEAEDAAQDDSRQSAKMARREEHRRRQRLKGVSSRS
jgi:sterol 3beta-glucosyltransferase